MVNYYTTTTSELEKLILSPLRLFKNKKQLSKKFKFEDVFPSDIKPKDFNENTSQMSDILLNPIIEIHHYLNALKIYKTYELMIDKDLPIQQNEFHFFSIKQKRTLKFKLSFKKIYYHILANPNEYYFWCSDNYGFRVDKYLDCLLKADIYISELLNRINFRVSKNNILPCSITGYFFRKNDLLPLAEMQNKYFVEYCNQHFKKYKLNDDIKYINIRYVKGYGTHDFKYALTKTKQIFFIYIKELNHCVSEFEKDIIEKYPVVYLKSSKNRLREYNFAVHNNLPKQCLSVETHSEKQLYLGIEHEVCYTKNSPSKIHQLIEEEYLKGLAICKRDGSVNNGFEINFVPMTFDYIKATDLFFKFFEKTKHFLRSFNVADTGIHIHINRKSLSLSDIGKIIQFINSSSNRDYIIKLTGRKTGEMGYCVLNKDYSAKVFHQVVKEIRPKDDREYKAYSRAYDKYNAVNIEHSKTLEIRIFKGNTKPQTISRYIEFTHCLVMFVKQASLKELNQEQFNDFVKSNKHTYPFLNEFNQHFYTGLDTPILKDTFTYKPRIEKIFKNKFEIPKIDLDLGHKRIKRNRKIIKSKRILTGLDNSNLPSRIESEEK